MSKSPEGAAHAPSMARTLLTFFFQLSVGSVSVVCMEFACKTDFLRTIHCGLQVLNRVYFCIQC